MLLVIELRTLWPSRPHLLVNLSQNFFWPLFYLGVQRYIPFLFYQIYCWLFFNLFLLPEEAFVEELPLLFLIIWESEDKRLYWFSKAFSVIKHSIFCERTTLSTGVFTAGYLTKNCIIFKCACKDNTGYFTCKVF